MPSDSSRSRRTFVSDMGAGLIAGLVASGAKAASGPPIENQPSMTPPAYPTPPFPRQEQPWPGLVSRMQPRPDHGETSYKGTGRLKGRKALITGGDSGMGRAAAIAFAREGADVAINYLPAEESDAQEVVQLIHASGRKAVALAGDLRQETFCTELIADAISQLGGLDILVNNAGRQHAVENIVDISTQQFDDTFKTNVYAMFWLSRAAVPHMPPGSAIINTASVNAYDPSAELLDYSATKGAIMIFTKSLAKQLAKKSIRVNAVAPGPIWTALQPSGGQLPDRLPQFGADTPMGRPGQPAELASLYVLLASNEATYTTGQVFGAVGGRGGP
jgi:NAD(P)-dependent dehydrogenase (short-subunit alcohol dehydrogenase family)